ncbi:MAG: heme transport system permease protein [Acidobacteriota bacterium]|jgi:iron complex transport system permease protein|nr:heme transport system permease protein [Acidobacteriota bacterium]
MKTMAAAGQSKLVRGARSTFRRTLIICLALLAALLIVIVAASVIGAEHLPLASSLRALFTGGSSSRCLTSAYRWNSNLLEQVIGSSSCGLTPDQSAILFDIRLPRILLAASVGASLATAGAGYQALLRNPLAEPYLLGISNGAAVGTMIALVFFGQTIEWMRPLMAFAGALAATFVVYRLARGRSGTTPEKLILAGVIVTTFLSSAIVFITTLMDATRIRSFTFWLLGDLSGASSSLLIVAIISAIVGATLLTLYSRSLNLMMLGERDAFDLGVEVGRVRLVVFLAASLLVGASVASAGSVGYVGLVVPHLVRLSMGSDNRMVMPAAALTGALFVIVADTVARTVIAPRELPVGAITALIGAPLFIYLLRRG